MPDNANALIRSELEKYEREPLANDKKAVLLTPQGGFFLYGSRFCGIEEYELELYSKSLQIQGRTVQNPLLLSVLSDGLHVAREQPCVPDLVSLIFHIRLGGEGLLRGILHGLGREAQLSLFCEESMEALYRLSRRGNAPSEIGPPPDETLLRQAEAIRRNNLHWLTELYLRGQNLKQLDAGFFQ